MRQLNGLGFKYEYSREGLTGHLAIYSFSITVSFSQVKKPN